MWLQESGESGGQTDLERADDDGIVSAQFFFVRFSDFLV